MISPRTTIVSFEKFDAKDRAKVNVRAATKMGAVLAARINSASFIPVRDQRLVSAKIKDTERLFNVWEVNVEHQQVTHPK